MGNQEYFFDMCLQKLLRDKGLLGFITPNTFLLQPRYSDLRKFLLDYQIEKILNLGEGIFDAVVPTAIAIISNNQAIEKHTIAIADLTKESKFLGNFDSTNWLLNEQKLYLTTPNNIFVGEIRLLLDDEVLLNEILDMKDGGFKYQRVNVGLSQKGNNDLAERLFYTGKIKSSKDIPILIGKDIDKNGFCLSGEEKRFLIHNYKSILKQNEIIYYNKEIMSAKQKLIWRQTAPYFIGCVLYGTIWFCNTIQGATVKEKYKDNIKIEYLACILNSKFMRSIYEKSVKEGGRVFPQVKLEKLKPLPIKIISIEQQ